MAKKIKNEKVAATQLRSSELSHERISEKGTFNHEQYLGVTAKIAGTTICNRNWKFKNCDKHFPVEPLLRTVDKYYPGAKGGPLYADEPVTEEDEKDCVRKAKALKSEGLRYIWVKTNDDGTREIVGEVS